MANEGDKITFFKRTHSNRLPSLNVWFKMINLTDFALLFKILNVDWLIEYCNASKFSVLSVVKLLWVKVPGSVVLSGWLFSKSCVQWFSVVILAVMYVIQSFSVELH